jgi:PKD repeat protein
MASNGGGSDNGLKTDYIIVTYPAPIVDFSTDNLSPTTFDEVSFTDLSTYFPYAWTWSFSPSSVTYTDGTDQNSQHPKVLFDREGLYTVELTATNDGGDGTLTKIDYIDVREALSVTATASPDEICYGESSQLLATPAGGTGTYTYSWTSNPSGFNSMEQNPVVSPLVTTVYAVEVSDGEHSVNADVEILVDQLPEITLGDWPELLCNQEEPPVQLSASPTGGIYSGNQVTSGGLFSPEEATIGWHVITYNYEDENGCESSKQDSIYVDNCVGIHSQLINESSVMIFPNPNKGTFTIKSDHLIQKVEIVNMLGEIQFTKSFSENEINLQTQLVEGIYIIHIFVINKKGDSQILKKKIIVN